MKININLYESSDTNVKGRLPICFIGRSMLESPHYKKKKLAKTEDQENAAN
jgi:hypothetical protein